LSVDTVVRRLEENFETVLGQLKELLSIPSISADSKYKEDLRRAAEYVRKHLESAGLTVSQHETKGHPIVYAEWMKAQGKPAVLVYGHYDVQPPDPLNEWVTPAFEPTVRNGALYARGATDDKGQLWTHIAAVTAWLKETGSLPVNVKFLIEGEEEVGSNNLDIFIEANRDRLKCDVAVISDTSQYGPDIPAITYGLRGILACEVTVHGPRQDLHSGVFGGSIANPINALCRMIAALHDDQGRIQIPGFYDGVIESDADERKRLAALPFNEAEYLKSLGVSAGHGEAGWTALERRWCRPTCDVNGLHGGYGGEGPKTIIPAKATAKITCRLVPHQDAAALTKSLEQFLRSKLPPGLRMEFTTWHGCPAVLCDTSSPYMAAARSAIAKGFGFEPVLIREGGSIPVVATFRKLLAVDTLLLGWGQNSDNLHGPNEHFNLRDFKGGLLSSAHLWQELAR
jgi:acetylornithine deacetylase/succinyl-diaminopimelate desuccinylase-like protein